MFELVRLVIARQRRLLGALQEAAADKAFVKELADPVSKALHAAVLAGEPLDDDHVVPPIVVDNSADAAIGGFHTALVGIEKALSDRLIKPLPPERAKKKASARDIRQRAFPKGTGFLGDAMSLQYTAMKRLVKTLRAKPCADGVTVLGLGYLVDHIEDHLAPYGRAVKTRDNRDLEEIGAAFHEAYTTLALLVTAHHAGDDDVKKRLINPYRNELSDQRQDERAARARSARNAAEAEAAGDAEAEADA
jgi:hypothetical protein